MPPKVVVGCQLETRSVLWILAFIPTCFPVVEQLSSATVSAAAAAAADCVSTARDPTSSVHVASAAAVSASVVTPTFWVLKLAAVAVPSTFAGPAVLAHVGTIGVSSVPALTDAGAKPQTRRALIERYMLLQVSFKDKKGYLFWSSFGVFWFLYIF